MKGRKYMRIGTGYDVHKLVQGRDLIIGGVKIPHTMGLLGHSDADVLIHAVMDAVLGAAALGDIGLHFPDTDPRYEGADSIMLLKEVKKLIEDKYYMIENIDATVIAQKPKLRPYIDQMKQNIADALETDPDRINIKATTEEGMGFTGEERGISAQAVCLLSSMFENQQDVTSLSGCGACPVRNRQGSISQKSPADEGSAEKAGEGSGAITARIVDEETKKRLRKK